MCFTKYGFHAAQQYSSNGLTKTLKAISTATVDLYPNDLRIKPIPRLALAQMEFTRQSQDNDSLNQWHQDVYDGPPIPISSHSRSNHAW